jgi:hypothetical protein
LNKATPVKALQPERALNDANPEYNSFTNGRWLQRRFHFYSAVDPE